MAFVSRKFTNTISHVDSYQYYIVSACVRAWSLCRFMHQQWNPVNGVTSHSDGGSPLSTLQTQLGSFRGFKCEVGNIASSHFKLYSIYSRLSLQSLLPDHCKSFQTCFSAIIQNHNLLTLYHEINSHTQHVTKRVISSR